MIDLHTHILPGLDDGARDMDTAIAMAKMALADGIDTLVATPHVMTGVYENTKIKILDNISILEHELQKHDLKLKIICGAEYYLEPNLPDLYLRGELLAINDNGKYLLVELPSAMVPAYTSEVLYQLQLQGVTPIIAHPERNTGFVRQPQLLEDLVKRGAKAQVTADSLDGSMGKVIQKTALQFVKQGLVHIIASDAHSARRRPPTLSSGVKVLRKQFQSSIADDFSLTNPNLVIQGEGLPSTAQCEFTGKKSRMNLFHFR